MPPPSPPLPPHVRHLRVKHQSNPPSLSSILSSHLDVPRDFALELIAFGAVWYSSSEEVPLKKGCKCTRARNDHHLVAHPHREIYVRVHCHPKRFPRALQVNWKEHVLHEAASFLAIDKPWGVNVAPTVDNLHECVLGKVEDQVFSRTGSDHEQARITHRLDAGTSGVLVLARTKAFCAYFNALLAQGRVRKVYRVLTSRRVPRGIMTHYAQTEVRRKGRPAWTVMHDSEGEGRSKCQLRVLSCTKLADDTYYESTVELLTGRTHQIRAQFSKENACLVGDRLYGEGEEEGRLPDRIGLQASSLTVVDEGSPYFPSSGITFNAGLPWWRTEIET